MAAVTERAVLAMSALAQVEVFRFGALVLDLDGGQGGAVGHVVRLVAAVTVGELLGLPARAGVYRLACEWQRGSARIDMRWAPGCLSRWCGNLRDSTF